MSSYIEKLAKKAEEKKENSYDILKQASVNLEDFDSGFDTQKKKVASASHHLVRALDILNVMDNKEAAHAVSHVIHKLAEEISKKGDDK